MIAFHLQFIWDPTSSLVNLCLHTQGRKAEGARVRKRECWQETNKEKTIFTMSIWQSTCCVATTVHTDPHVTSSGIKLRWAKHGLILQNHSQNKAQVFVIFFLFWSCDNYWNLSSRVAPCFAWLPYALTEFQKQLSEVDKAMFPLI